MLSMTHMIVVFVIVLIVFGPQKLPELARGLGKLMAEFRKASTDFRSAFEQEMRDIERQALQAERKKAAEATAIATPNAAEKPAALAPPSGDVTPAASSEADNLATDAPIITPVAESVPRSSNEPGETSEEATQPVAADEPSDPTHDHQHPA